MTHTLFRTRESWKSPEYLLRESPWSRADSVLHIQPMEGFENREDHPLTMSVDTWSSRRRIDHVLAQIEILPFGGNVHAEQLKSSHKTTSIITKLPRSMHQGHAIRLLQTHPRCFPKSVTSGASEIIALQISPSCARVLFFSWTEVVSRYAAACCSRRDGEELLLWEITMQSFFIWISDMWGSVGRPSSTYDTQSANRW